MTGSLIVCKCCRSRTLADEVVLNILIWWIKTLPSLMMIWPQRRSCKMLTSSGWQAFHRPFPSPKPYQSMRRDMLTQRTRQLYQIKPGLHILPLSTEVIVILHSLPLLPYIFEACLQSRTMYSIPVFCLRPLCDCSGSWSV